MSLIVKKTRILNNDDFEYLIKIDKELVKNMLRNKVTMQGNKIGNKIIVREHEEWLEQNCNGFVYIHHNDSEKKFDISIYFEEETDFIGFKLRWS